MSIPNLVNGDVAAADRPPQNIEAERGAIGSMLMDNAIIGDVQTILNPSDFYYDRHERICRGIYDVFADGHPVDSITLEERLATYGDLERVGGLDAILDILGSVPHSANATYYAQIIKEKAIARRVIEAGQSMIRSAHANNMTAAELLEEAEGSIFGISESERTGGHSGLVSDFAAESIVTLERQKQQGHVPGIRTGFFDIDDLLGGSDADQVVILGARPSMGKTALALQIATNIGELHGLSSLYISLEMSEKEVSNRMLSMRSGVNAQLFRNPRALSSEHFGRLAEAQELLRRLPPFVVEADPIMSMTYIQSAARKWRSKVGVGIIFVDYIQLIDVPETRDNRQEQISKISRRLKMLSREVGVPIFALSQLNRQVENREQRIPRLADLRESGAIEQDAHAVALMHRPEFYDPAERPGLAEVIVAKNRNGPIGSAWLQFDKPCMRFSDLAPDGLDEPDF